MESTIAPKSAQRISMEIYGHELIDYDPLYLVQNKDEIDDKNGKYLLFFEYNPMLIKYCQDKKLQFALHVFNPIEAVIGNCVGAKLLICPKKIAFEVQELAEFYLFDSKIAILINSEDEIADAIEKKVDVAILPGAIL